MTVKAITEARNSLPPTVSLVVAAQLLGIGRTAAYELVRSDLWPTPVLRLGRSIRIPTVPLLAALGLMRATSPEHEVRQHAATDR